MRFPGFIGPSYQLQSVNVDAQRCVNLYPEINELGTGKEREVASLVPTPGLRLLATLGEGPVRGLWRASNGELYAVGGSKMYRVVSGFIAIEIGTLQTSSGPVSMADNGIHVVAVDGSFGYSFEISINLFSQITNSDFHAADQVVFQDGYFIFNKAGSQQFFTSDLNSIDFDPLDTGSAEGSPDPIVGIASSRQNLFVFGSQSTEAFYNSGSADFPFARIQGAVVGVGCHAAFSIQNLQGVPYWLGGDDTGHGIIYRMQGFQPERISTPAIESVIRGLDTEELKAARAWTYQQGGHPFYCINLPGADSTWVFDAATSLWHERQFRNDYIAERHRADCHALAYGENVVGDYESGKLYALDLQTHTDDGTSIVRMRTAPHFSDGPNLIRHNSFQLDMETGVGLDGAGQGTDPRAALTWSDDGGHTWSNERWKAVGKIGEKRKRVIWRRLGASRDRVYRVMISDPVKVVLIGAELSVEEGAA